MNRKAAVVIVLLALVAGAGLWWWRAGRGARDGGATPTATSTGSGATRGSADSAGSGSSAFGAPAVRGAAHVSVRVTDTAGPLADATVRAAPAALDGDDPPGPEAIVVARTGADGTAALELAPGTWQLSAAAPGHVAAAAKQAVTSGASVTVALVLATGGRALTGTVTDASGGPIAGARVDAAHLGAMARPDDAIATAITGADGKYALAVPEGALLVAAMHADYAPQARHVDVGPTGAVADFALVPGGVIEGVVRDDKTRAPVGGARVIATRDGGGSIGFGDAQQRRVLARADGTFRIGGLRPGAYDLSASQELRTSRAPTRVGLGVAEQLGDVEILVGSGPVVRGKVVGEHGLAVGNATITAFGPGGGDERPTTSAADGTFALAGLATGRFMLMAQGAKWLPDGTTPVEIADRDVDGVIVHVRGAARVAGHVEPRQACEVRFDLDKGALRDGTMPMLVRPTQAGADGTFALEPVSPGPGTVAARCANGDEGSVAVDVRADLPEVIVKVSPGASIAGKLVDANGKPVAGVGVMASATTGTEHIVVTNGMITSGAQTLTDANGAYTIGGLTAARYRVAALDRGRLLPAVGGKPTEVTLAATEHKTGVDLAVALPDGTIDGVVVGADGKPIADAWVSVRRDLASMLGELHDGGPGNDDGEARMTTIESSNEDDGSGLGNAADLAPVLTDASGRFAFKGLAKGKYLVVAEAQAGKLRGRQADVTPNATITLAAVPLASVTGRVHASAPLGVYTVELDGPTRTIRSFVAPAATPTEASFELGHVDPGAYTIRVTSSAGNGEVKTTVAPSGPTAIEVTLAANAVVIGKLVDAKGAPVGGIGVALVPDGGDGRVSLSLEGPPPTSGPDGTFRLEAKAGAMVLIAMTPPKPFVKRGLALVAGKTLDVGTLTLP